ncbi:MAG TPA: hypothetical protein VMH87_13515 [Pseudomonadales bacterium]|nr:hypothetical protein [Pseudomonadales bacterium]
MKIFPSSNLSDAEFVEKVRKQLRKGRRWAWMGLIGSVMFVVLFVWFIYVIVTIVGGFSSKDSSVNQHLQTSMEWYRTGLATGVCFGVFATFLLAKAFWCYAEFLLLLAGNRRDKLLIALYDELHPLEAKAPAPSTAEKTSH